MSISKIIRSSRSFPLGSVDEIISCKSLNGCELLIIVKYLHEISDVLCIQVGNSYICRYKFPRCSWNLEDIVDFLKKEL